MRKCVLPVKNEGTVAFPSDSTDIRPTETFETKLRSPDEQSVFIYKQSPAVTA